jgi:hypothetical protein
MGQQRRLHRSEEGSHTKMCEAAHIGGLRYEHDGGPGSTERNIHIQRCLGEVTE